MVWSKYGPDFRARLDKESIENDEYRYYMTDEITPYDILDDYYDEYVCGDSSVIQRNCTQIRRCLMFPPKGGLLPDGYFEPCSRRGFWEPIDRSNENDRRDDPRYITWRKEVFKRDNYTCQECGAKVNLEAHHIKQVIFHPHLIYEVDNGITLCRDCHRMIPVFRRCDLENNYE